MKKIASVELLRFISAMAVIIWHYQHFYLPYNFFSNIEILNTNRDQQPFFEFLSLFYKYGNRGVDFFFLISGFVFAYVYLAERKVTNLKIFFVNRFARLYPLHLLTLIIVAILQFFTNENFNNYLIHSINDIYHFILNFFFISAWGFEKGPSFNGPIWSVSIEIIVYFMFFFLIVKMERHRVIISSIIVFVFISFQKLIGDDLLNFINVNLINCVILFFLGVLIHYLMCRIKEKKFLFVCGLSLLFLSILGNVKFYILFPSVLILFLSFENLIQGKLCSFFSFLGNLTYGTYLWHLPIQIVLMIIFKIIGNDFSITNEKIFFILYITSVISVSIVSYFFFEKKARFFIREKFNKLKISD